MANGYRYEFNKDDAFAFAQFVNTQTRMKDDELEFKTCPYCNGRGKGNEFTFSINLNSGVHKCLRSSCDASGNMVTLAKDFDFKLSGWSDAPVKKYRSFKKPTAPIVPKEPAVSFLESRGISEDIAKRYEITIKDHDNILAFPFFDETGNLVFIKYRKTDFDKAKDSNKEWCEKNCKPILFGMKQCNLDNKILIITEGQMDSLSVAEAGFENAVSVPTGAKGFTWVPHCWEWLHNFDTLIVFGDHEKGTITLLDELKTRLKFIRIKVVREEDYKDCKDANDILRKYGKEQIKACIENAKDIPVQYVISLADVKDLNPFDLPKMKTGFRDLDELLYGGLPFGGITLVTGKSGEGKLLADETPVFTRNGWKRHGDLIVGDEVIGRYGKFVKVTHVFPKANANMKITMNNGEIFYCHENHEWVTDLHSGSGYRENIMTAKELYEKKQSGFTHPLRLIARKPLDDGTDNGLFVKPYTLGAWLGDGRNNNPDICNPPMDYCVTVRILRDGYKISWQTIHKDTGVIYTGFEGLRDDLQKYGMCHSRRRVEKYIPHEYLVASLEDRLALLAGLLDTDGYYDAVKGAYSYATTEEKLCDSFIDLVHTFGWNCSHRVQKARTSSSGVVGRKDVHVISFVPSGLEIPCVVERKKQHIVKPYTKRRNAISEIEYCEDRQGNCIEVEGGVYCVGKSMIPTHNSTVTSQMLLYAIEEGHKVFAYSGELPNAMFKSWMTYQAAGSEHVFKYRTKWGNEGYKVSDANKQKIYEWFRDSIFVYSNENIEGDEKADILKITEDMITRFGTDVILIDNLMTGLDLMVSRDTDKYEKQSRFVKSLTRLALKYNVLILLVAHMRKNNYSMNGNDEVAGSSDITNLCSVTLMYEKDRENPNNRKLKCWKNRIFGKTNTDGWDMYYDDFSKRVYGDRDNVKYQFGWCDGFDTTMESPFM